MANPTVVVLVKPDGVERALIGSVLATYEHAGFRAINLRFFERGDASLHARFAEHYAPHRGKEHYQALVEEMGAGPAVAVLLEAHGGAAAESADADGAVALARQLRASLRSAYARDVRHNTVHASDSPSEAQREAAVWFRAPW